MKDETYKVNLDEYEQIGNYWILLYVNIENVIYCDSFGVEHIPKEIRKFIGSKNIITNIYKLQAYDSIIWGYFCIVFINFVLKVKLI